MARLLHTLLMNKGVRKNMPAIATISREKFTEQQILNSSDYVRMRSEGLLSDDECSLVIPVRRKDQPHFRRIGGVVYQTSLQPQEQDKTHGEAIAAIMNILKTQVVEITTPTFDVEGRLDPEGQVLFGPVSPGDYHWWDDSSGTRIPLNNGRYIQPDICGRASTPAAFSPTTVQPNVIIEVIQTHLPEKETLYELLQLSAMNYIVVLYFVAPGRKGTKYSRLSSPRAGGRMRILAAHYLSGRRLLENGQQRGEPAPYSANDYDIWYASQQVLLARVMRAKNESPPGK